MRVKYNCAPSLEKNLLPLITMGCRETEAPAKVKTRSNNIDKRPFIVACKSIKKQRWKRAQSL